MTVSTLLNQLGLYATGYGTREASYRGSVPVYVRVGGKLFRLESTVEVTDGSFTLSVIKEEE